MTLEVGTVTINAGHSIQANFLANTTFTADTAYPQAEGGYDMDALLDVKGKLKDFVILHLHMEPFYDTSGTTGYFGVWDKATNRLKIYLQADGAEAADDGDLSAIVAAKIVIWAV